MTALAHLLADETAGDPLTGLKWTHRTLRSLAKALRQRQFHASPGTVRRLLGVLRYAQRINRKRVGRRQDPDRDQQMRHIRRQRRAFLKADLPVISVDTKKKEWIGNFRNPGRTWRQQPHEVLATDFASDAQGKAIPYGVYDVKHNLGYVIVGISHETAEFAVNAIRHWWRKVGRAHYPAARHLLIEADGGGANGSRSWRWKAALQQLADECQLVITVSHLPPAASKWNLTDHRLFAHISQNWAGQPLRTYETVLKFIRTTKTESGLRCRAWLDRRDYPLGIKLTVEQKKHIRLKRHTVLPRWNYTIKPH